MSRLRDTSQFGKEIADRAAESFADPVVGLQLQVASFSDSIIVTSWLDPNPESPDGLGFCVGVTTAVCAMIGVTGVLGDPPFLYRGAIAAGQFAADENRFFVGEAIDEAAKLEGLAEGGLIFLTPSAVRVGLQYTRTAAIPEYPVPIKGGATFRTSVANPFAVVPAPRNADYWRSLGHRAPTDDNVFDLVTHAFDAAFKIPNDLSIEIKRQNTMEFLSKAKGETNFGSRLGSKMLLPRSARG